MRSRASCCERAVFYIVPNMNPDGAALGLTRCNGAGANLNREWQSPSLERSPEVVHIRARMEATGVDFCLDVHGDEELRCVFLGGPLEIPSRSERLAGLFRDFELSWAAATPEYELGHPYPGGAPARGGSAHGVELDRGAVRVPVGAARAAVQGHLVVAGSAAGLVSRAGAAVGCITAPGDSRRRIDAALTNWYLIRMTRLILIREPQSGLHARFELLDAAAPSIGGNVVGPRWRRQGT